MPRGTAVRIELLQGTLDLLILKVLALAPNHGWGIADRVREISRDSLNPSQGSLYPALHRLERNGHVVAETTTSRNNRRARVYRLTPAGQHYLRLQIKHWGLFVSSVTRILQASESG